MPKIKYPNSNTVLSLSAIFISLCALIVSIYEFRVMKVQQQAAVWVHVDVGISYSSEGLTVYAVNNGVGPALIKSVQVSYKGKYFENWQEVFDYFLDEGHSLTYSIYKVNGINEGVLPPSEKVKLLFIPWNNYSRKVEKDIRKLKMQLIYTNILEECWELSFSNKGKKRFRLKNCKFDKKDNKEFY